MTITSLTSMYFHAQLPDVLVHTTADAVRVSISLGSECLYDETLHAFGGVVTLSDLDQLVEPWLLEVLTGSLRIEARELDDDGNGTSVTAVASTRVVYGWVDTGVSASEFCNGHFLTLLNGVKRTGRGRLEYLHLIGSGGGSVTAYYSDGTKGVFSTTTAGGNGSFTTLDVSPDRFEGAGKQLVKYVVTVGSRRQEFVMDLDEPDCAPCLLFTNSFGCQEMVYCVGKHEVNPDYKRTSAFIGKRRRNYRIREERRFMADTGMLTTGEMNWVDDLFRSKEIYVVTFVGGKPRVGREVIVTDSTSEFSNEVDAVNRAQFTYMYAQRCHNVVDAVRAGRVFDNTFDNTFD